MCKKEKRGERERDTKSKQSVAMAEEFQAGVCGPTWWNPARSSLGISQCSAAINDMGSFGWPGHDFVGAMNSSSSTSPDVDHHQSGSVSDHGSSLFQAIQKPHQTDSGGGALVGSTLQMVGIGLSSSSTTTNIADWNQTLLSGRSESNYHSSIVQEDMDPRLNFLQETRIDHCPTNIDSTSNGYPSTLIQTLVDQAATQPQQSLFDEWSSNYPSTTNYPLSFNDQFPSSVAKLSPLLRPSLPKHQHVSTPFWSASTAALNDIRASLFPSTQTQFLGSTFEEKTSCPNLTAKSNINGVVQESGGLLVKRNGNEPAFKRPRIETPSPLPTFKVRKEKLGDRITALQQLVSPFGKTDTASVLQEAIEYIKFLHDQVSVLSTPYMKNGVGLQHQQTSDSLKDPEGPKQDLRSRGLCLVPISSTFPVANETTADFWTPTFGGTFR